MKVPILLPNIFNHPFTYNSDLKLKVGDYVVVPFGKSELTGIVWSEFEKKTNKNFAIKKVLRKLDVPSLKKNTINFLNWFSEYNMTPKGMALKLLLLSGNVVEEISSKFYEQFQIDNKQNEIELSKEQKNCLKKMNISNIKVIPDGSGLFTKYMGMLISKDHDGFGQRSWRYMAIINDGIVEKWWQEPGINNSGSDEDPYVETTPENSISYLSEAK